MNLHFDLRGEDLEDACIGDLPSKGMMTLGMRGRGESVNGTPNKVNYYASFSF